MPRPVLYNKRSRHNEKPEHPNWSSPHCQQLEKAHMQQESNKGLLQPKIIINKLF